jgi:hypothetical protein
MNLIYCRMRLGSMRSSQSMHLNILKGLIAAINVAGLFLTDHSIRQFSLIE